MADVQLDWNNLGFEYRNLPYRYRAYYKDGEWVKHELTGDATLHISEGSTALHYGQQDFEGLKAYRTKDGSVQLFRPDRNAARMQTSCERLLMPQVPTDMFVDAVKQVVKANQDYVPPYGTGATLYLRPLMIGVGGNIGVHPAQEYIFTVFAMPVGSYFKGGMTPTNFTTSEYDRAAHKGTGAYKVGGTTLPAYSQVKKRTPTVIPTVFIWIPLNIRRLKKLVPQTSLGLPRTAPSSHRSHHRFYLPLRSIHYFTLRNINLV